MSSAYFEHIEIKLNHDNIVTATTAISEQIAALATTYSKPNPGILLNDSVDRGVGAVYNNGYSYDYSSTIDEGSELSSVGVALTALGDELTGYLQSLESVVQNKIQDYSDIDYKYAPEFMEIEDLLSGIDTASEGGV